MDIALRGQPCNMTWHIERVHRTSSEWTLNLHTVCICFFNFKGVNRDIRWAGGVDSACVAYYKMRESYSAACQSDIFLSSDKPLKHF